MNAESPLQKALPIPAETADHFKVEFARLNKELADGWRVVETAQLGEGALVIIEKMVSDQDIEQRRRYTERLVEVMETKSDDPIITPPPDQSES